MKNRWKKSRSYLLLAALAAGTAGCTFENGTEIETEHFTVNRRDWNWNDAYKRYEYIFDYAPLGRDIYEEGTVLGGVYVTEREPDGDPYQVLKTLPLVESFPFGNDGVYTRTISFDIAPRQVTFYIQSSDLSDDEADLETYEFKITLVWEQDRH